VPRTLSRAPQLAAQHLRPGAEQCERVRTAVPLASTPLRPPLYSALT